VKSQSPLVGSKRRRYQQRRAVRSGTFRRFRSAFAKEHRPPLSVGNGPYRKDADGRHGSLLLRLSKTGILAGLLAVLLTVIIVRGWQALERSGSLRVRQVTVQGCRTLSERDVLALAEIWQGEPLLGIDLVKAEERVRSHPWIDTVSIRRVWPYGLHVQVQERRPLALINLEEEGAGLHYMDQHGRIFAALQPGQDIDFPVLTGISLPAGASLTEGPAAEAAQFLRLAAQGNPVLPLQAVSEVHVSRNGEIIAYLAERPFPIHLGYGNIRTRYLHLVKLLERLHRKEKIENIREIRMDYQADRILVAKTEP
jgi:cell division protein FtsQ